MRVLRGWPAVTAGALWTMAVVAGFGCAGGGDDDDIESPTPTPTPAGSGSLDFDFDASGFQIAHVGQTAFLRILGPASEVVFCERTPDPIPPEGVFSFEGVAVLASNASYSIELFANIDGNDTFDAGDHVYDIPVGIVITDLSIDFAHTTQSPSITWVQGTVCPGEPL